MPRKTSMWSPGCFMLQLAQLGIAYAIRSFMTFFFYEPFLFYSRALRSTSGSLTSCQGG